VFGWKPLKDMAANNSNIEFGVSGNAHAAGQPKKHTYTKLETVSRSEEVAE
jgi:hypothetical protein